MADVADYCRQVEAHLTRVNGGHLVRVVGAGFALVKAWADSGVPLSVVLRGIEQKAERHKAGASTRPLRIEFCEADVQALFAQWRRAVGMVETAAPAGGPSAAKPRSVPKVIDRGIERLGRLAGRLDLPDDFRDGVSHTIEKLTILRDALSGTRGAARQELLAQVAPLDQALLDAARRIVPPEVLKELTDQAEHDLATYRERMAPDAWAHTVTMTVDQGIRAHFKLPVLEL